jgi:hypothetical protein
MIGQHESSESENQESHLIDLAPTRKTSQAPHLIDSIIEPYGKHSEDLVQVLDGQLYVTDSQRPRPATHRNWIHQPYFKADPDQDLFEANKFCVEDGMMQMYYDVTTPRQDADRVKLRPTTPPEHARPYTAHTLEEKLPRDTSVPRHGVIPKPVSERGTEISIDRSFDRIKNSAKEYLGKIKTGRNERGLQQRPVTGVLIGEPYIKAPYDKTTNEPSLLAPTMTLYGKQAD